MFHSNMREMEDGRRMERRGLEWREDAEERVGAEIGCRGEGWSGERKERRGWSGERMQRREALHFLRAVTVVTVTLTLAFALHYAPPTLRCV